MYRNSKELHKNIYFKKFIYCNNNNSRAILISYLIVPGGEIERAMGISRLD